MKTMNIHKFVSAVLAVTPELYSRLDKFQKREVNKAATRIAVATAKFAWKKDKQSFYVLVDETAESVKELVRHDVHENIDLNSKEAIEVAEKLVSSINWKE